MASYKVPQDVEADDKLIGPFSFRQFIYLIIVFIAGALAWGLAQIFVGLALIPLPIILFFGALALPLKKDQPMEVYLAAVVSYHLKPKKRLWQPDGIQELVEIVAPRSLDAPRTKGFSSNEAEQRLSYLAQIADTRGWAVRGVVASPSQNTPMNDDLYYEAQQVPDVLDDTGTLGQTFGSRLSEADTQRKQDMVERMKKALESPKETSSTGVKFNPYPSEIHQAVIKPLGEKADNEPVVKDQTSTSEKEPSPDIISLASNPDLSIETIAHEAERIQKKEAGLGDNEVVISLR